jgi:hypothetical protein
MWPILFVNVAARHLPKQALGTKNRPSPRGLNVIIQERGTET